MSEIKYNIVDPMTVSYPFGVILGEIPSATVKTQSQILQETTNAILNGDDNKEEFSMPRNVKKSTMNIKVGIVLIVLLVLLFGYIFK